MFYRNKSPPPSLRPSLLPPLLQVYSFGGISVYMDSDVLFADLSGGGSSREARGNERKEGDGYAPVALEYLLQHVQSGGVGGGGGGGGGGGRR